MPLEIDDEVGGAASNSYSSVEAADLYASYRVGGAAFIALTEDQKIQALVTATSDIDTLEGYPEFIGERVDDTQALAWPRTGTDYGDAELPPPLVSATIEQAMSYVSAFAASYSGDVLNQNHADGNVKRKKIDVLETEWFAPRSTEATALERFPDAVQRLLLALLVATAIGGWGGSAVVSRGS